MENIGIVLVVGIPLAFYLGYVIGNHNSYIKSHKDEIDNLNQILENIKPVREKSEAD